MRESSRIEFAPRSSNGRTWVLAIAIGTLALFVVPLVIGRAEIPWYVSTFLLVAGLGTTAPLFVVAWYSASIRYIVTDSEIVLSMGRLIEDRIRFEQIRHIERRPRLRISLLASFRFPGLAVFDVDYLDVNRVRMLATSASKDILLIETTVKRYGITPADESAFLELLGQRLPDASVIRNMD